MSELDVPFGGSRDQLNVFVELGLCMFSFVLYRVGSLSDFDRVVINASALPDPREVSYDQLLV